ncbi:hypothetical protein CLAFUW4_00135 [Fulvia fulva]|uniref:Synaptobrevin n=1 Tax=Passalora fulva TaxID=5499 RepID=A0A9Q8L8H6_PASFU|nr:uncharacterized protein CLAFUR5_00133 [Fulvia fulva]KAK4634854.1 hypothetical protein CLAFUR4_00135 [Fulvia fulva]KAK4637450.1 hypothetical protein CLAFUR0_00133 [Fulvia fulva]UJO12731.1 hypothetical protein CLAFUR5_00133 [Fulvia fulva]WPV10387.1 hypothetical protein CLAFUW4_00135 [Fulvia fulva]WPV24006.1 hypothetical protein CLAFUW7_00135 [Fulvia fulva]
MASASPVQLNRLLARLEHTLLTANGDPHLQHSQYERSRVAANIEHARAMLLTLEKQSATNRIQIQRQEMPADLQSKRELIKRLNTRLREISDAAVESDDEDEDDEEDEHILNAYAPKRKDTEAGLESGIPQEPRIDETQQAELRSRKPNLQSTDNRSAASTTAREQLFAGSKPKDQTDTSSTQQTESLMSHNRTEQETLTSGLLGLAQALKESSLQFGASLEADKEVTKRAEGALDKGQQSMEAAQSKIGVLRRMSEGQGWIGRMKLYAMVFGLWVACFLLVFVGPKIRF